jgi:uncharacterized protein (DUF2147 family)
VSFNLFSDIRCGAPWRGPLDSLFDQNETLYERDEMKMLKTFVAFSVFSFLIANAYAADLAGLWRHAEEPVWLEIAVDGDAATGSIRRNDNKPELVGMTFLKEVKPDGNSGNQWVGQIYAESMKEFKDARINLETAEQMQIKVKVGFVSRTIKWQRVDDIPAD